VGRIPGRERSDIFHGPRFQPWTCHLAGVPIYLAPGFLLSKKYAKKKKSINTREARQARLFRDALVMRQRARTGLCDRAFWLPFWRHKKEEKPL